MKHLKPHLILESSNKLTKDHLDKIFSQFGVKSEFIPGRKGYQLPQFKVTIEEPKLYGRSYGYEDYLDYINQIRDLGEFHEKIFNCIQDITDEFDNKFEIDIVETGENNAWVNTIKKEITITFYV
jgi:hypothetical protein